MKAIDDGYMMSSWVSSFLPGTVFVLLMGFSSMVGQVANRGDRTAMPSAPGTAAARSTVKVFDRCRLELAGLKQIS